MNAAFLAWVETLTSEALAGFVVFLRVGAFAFLLPGFGELSVPSRILSLIHI